MKLAFNSKLLADVFLSEAICISTNRSLTSSPSHWISNAARDAAKLAALSRFVSSLRDAFPATPIRSYSSAPSHLISPVTRDAAKLAALSRLDDFNFLPRSELPTLHFQRSLPRLPIPRLEDTCQRYLAAQRPLLADAAYERTKTATAAFLSGEGVELNRKLITRDKRNKETSYISGWWFEEYLKDRRPLPLNFNPFVGFVDQLGGVACNEQLVRSTNFLVSAARLYNSMTRGTLDPEMYHLNPRRTDNSKIRHRLSLCPESLAFYAAYLHKIFPLDMSQYGNLFNSTRVPKIGKDEIVKGEGGHVIVLRKGHFYSLPILNHDGSIHDPLTIFAALKSIKNDPRPPTDFPVAAFTTSERDRWARAREALVAAGNGAALDEIDSALFCLSLDEATPFEEGKLRPNERLALSDIFLHGVDGVNRWFDKSVSLIVCANGKAGVNFEHAWGDGVAVLRFFNELFGDSNSRPAMVPSDAAGIPAVPVKRIEFFSDEWLRAELCDVLREHLETVKTLKTGILIHEGAGRASLKGHKLSPDGLFQLAFQMAYYRLTGKTTATYESCSTSAFRHGRTETLRPGTVETKTCSEAFVRPSLDLDVGDFLDLIKASSTKHSRLTKEAAMGQGFDRHLFALKKIAEESSDRLPDLFVDDAFSSIHHNVLSTSTLGAIGADIGGFAPVVPEGFGIGYMLIDDMIGCNVTSFEGRSDVHAYLDCLKISLDDIFDVLNGRDFRDRKK